MKRETCMPLLASLLLAVASAPAPLTAQQTPGSAAQQAASEMVPVPATIVARNVPPIPRERVEDLLPHENIPTGAAARRAASERGPVPRASVARNVPPIPRERVEDLLPYENIRTAATGDWHPTERKMYIRTRFANSLQLHEVAMPMGARTQLTFFNDPVMTAAARPNNPDQVVFSVNENGAENFQLYLLDRKNGRSRRFTDGKSRYQSALWSRDGKLLAYHSNARNGRDSDLYVADPATPGSERLVAQPEGNWRSLEVGS